MKKVNTAKSDLNELKQEVNMKEHSIPLEQLLRDLETDVNNVSC